MLLIVASTIHATNIALASLSEIFALADKPRFLDVGVVGSPDWPA